MEKNEEVAMTPELEKEIMAFVRDCRMKEPKIGFTKLKSKVKKKFKVILE